MCPGYFSRHIKITPDRISFSPPHLQTFPLCLQLLPDEGDFPAYLRKALFSFMVNVAYLNTLVNDDEENYSFLIHTSGKKADHSVDYKWIQKAFEILREDQNPQHEKYYEEIFNIASKRYPNHAEEIMIYILENNSREQYRRDE